MDSAVAVAPGESTHAQAIREALANARSPKAPVREKAIWYLRGIGVDGMNALLQIVAQEDRNRRKRRHRLLWCAGVYAGIFVLVAVIALQFDVHMPMFLSMFGSMSGVLSGAVLFSQTHRSAIRALSDFDDIRVTGAVVEALQVPDRDMYALASRALCRLLPRLRASDTGILNVEQRAILNRTLSRAAKRRPELALAILAALSQVGDEKALPAVTALAALPRGSRIRQEVVAAAQQCLPLLQQRAIAQETDRHLLRPADNVGREDSLLRAAAPTSADPTGLLLPSAGAPPTAQAVNSPALSDSAEVRPG
ncbi:MAG: hypothetical protein KGJ62_02500 [Armatimonadetes bacterium]|nr:hypothetical protein [Armatimonadota bacterium]MDE2205308.1 hypothetical protein [Armatimonadota bacterium]